MKQIVCPKGHYYSEVGRTSNGSCALCRKLYLRNYQKCNKKILRAKKHVYYKKRITNNLNFKIAVRLRHRIREAIKGNYKSGSAVRDLGCSIDYFKQYIEPKFHSGMNWDNWGKVWQLDHIKELREFDLSDLDQFKQAVHYTNFQPLLILNHIEKTAQNTHRFKNN